MKSLSFFISVLSVMALPVSGQAQDIRQGCYERIYSDAHMKKQPDQVVWQIRLKVGSGPAQLEVVAANQGHARINDMHGRALTQDLFCTGGTCRAECDAGGLELVRQSSEGLTFRTRYLIAAPAGCEDGLDLAEKPGQWVSYRLNRVPNSICSGM